MATQHTHISTEAVEQTTSANTHTSPPNQTNPFRSGVQVIVQRMACSGVCVCACVRMCERIWRRGPFCPFGRAHSTVVVLTVNELNWNPSGWIVVAVLRAKTRTHVAASSGTHNASSNVAAAGRRPPLRPPLSISRSTFASVLGYSFC